MPVRLGNDSIEIIYPDKTYVVDTIKSTGERDGDTVVNVPVVSPEYYSPERMYPPTPPIGLPSGNDDASQTTFNFDLMEATTAGYISLSYYETQNTIVGFSQIIDNGLYEFRTNNSGATNGKFYRLFTDDTTNYYIPFYNYVDNTGLYNVIGHNDHDLTVFTDGSSQRGCWVEVGMPNEIVLTKYSFRMLDSPTDRNIRSLEKWIICGSNDRSTWTIIHNVPSDIVSPDAVLDVPGNLVDIVYQTFDTPLPFKYIRKIFIKIDTDTWFAHTSLKLYGKEKLVKPQPIAGTTEYKVLTFPYNETRYPKIDADSTNLIAHYKFDDDTNKGLNSAISTNSIGDASLNGTPTLNSSEYVIGKSSYFSGSGDHSFVLDNNSANLYNAIYQKPITIAFWCKSLETGQGGHGRLFYGAPTGSGNNINSIQCVHWGGNDDGQSNAAQLTFIISNNSEGSSGNYMYTTLLPAFNTAWSHIAFVIEPQSTNWNTKEHTAKIYVNGVLEQTFTNIWYPPITQNYDFEIGRWTTNEDSREYDGYLDDFRIYDKALSQEEITDLYNQYNQTPYTLTFDNPTECDILIVGGGGGGDGQIGGGGGGGAVLYAQKIEIPADTYTIKVGNGGNQNQNGFQSEAFGATCLGGGSTTYIAWNAGNNGNSGGSGSGGSSVGTNAGGGVGSSIEGTFLQTHKLSNGSIILYNGNIGGSASIQTNEVSSGGGGGAYTAGNNGTDATITTLSQYQSNGYPAKGGDGVQINIDGNNYYWGGGGGGGSYVVMAGTGGLGGGGAGGQYNNVYIQSGGGGGMNLGQDGGTNGVGYGGDGGEGTGGGGGGGGYNATQGGNGGSGIVIIRYKQQYNQVPFNAQWTYSALDTSVHHYGNVGIGTTASDTTKLAIRGDVNVIGDYYKNDTLLTEQWKTSSQNTNNIYREQGFVGIGTNNVDYGIHVIGQLYAGSGGITGNGSTAWTSTSDSRVKQNIVPASGQKCVENVRNINLYRFNYNSSLIDTDDKHQLGFIAQEVQQYYPKAVKTNNLVLKNNMKIDNLLSVDVTQINYTLYGTVKKLAEDINTIREKLGITEIQTDVKNLAYVRKDGEDSDGLKIS